MVTIRLKVEIDKDAYCKVCGRGNEGKYVDIVSDNAIDLARELSNLFHHYPESKLTIIGAERVFPIA